MKIRSTAFSIATAMLLTLSATSVSAETVNVSFSRLSGLSGVNGTAIFVADLSALSISEIQSITLIDSNSRVGGSSGAYSGFDLDAIKLSNTLATTAAGASAATGLNVFNFSPSATLFTPGTQRPTAAPKLNGTDASGLNVDASFATLSQFDAIWFGAGSVTLGDGGRISFNLTTPTSTAGLYLYVGEVSGDPGEALAGSLLVSNQPAVPEPSSLLMLLAGAGVLGGFIRKQRSVQAGA